MVSLKYSIGFKSSFVQINATMANLMRWESGRGGTTSRVVSPPPAVSIAPVAETASAISVVSRSVQWLPRVVTSEGLEFGSAAPWRCALLKHLGCHPGDAKAPRAWWGRITMNHFAYIGSNASGDTGEWRVGADGWRPPACEACPIAGELGAY